MWNTNYSGPIQAATKTKPGRAGVIRDLVKYRRSLYKKDLSDWESARQAATSVDYPLRRRLYELYADALLDSHLGGLIRKRILKVVNRPFELINQENEPESDNLRLIQTSWFRDFIRYAIESRFYGYSLMEFDWSPQGQEVSRVRLVDRRHVVPERAEYLKSYGDIIGPSYLEPPVSDWVIGVGDEFDLGLLEGVSLLYLLKKNAMGAWSEFIEIFGIPFRSAKTDSFDTQMRRELEDMLENMGGSAWALFPQGTEFEIHPNKQSDAHEVFDKMLERVNSEMSKAILGQTMTTDNGSSRSQAEVHQGTEDEITWADMAFITDLVNDRLIPFLKAKGYPLGDLFFRFKTDEHLLLKDKWAIDQGIIDRADKIRADENLRTHVASNYGIELEPVVEPVANDEEKDDEPPIEEDEEDEEEGDESGNFTGGPS